MIFLIKSINNMKCFNYSETICITNKRFYQQKYRQNQCY